MLEFLLTAKEKLSAIDAQPFPVESRDMRKLEIGCWAALIVVASIRAWLTRYELYYGDSLAYLDIAREIARGRPGAAIHAYWSPGYPVFVSFFLWLFRPGIRWEYPFVHFVNVLVFIGTLACFRIFWSEVLLWNARVVGEAVRNIPERAFWALGYASFSIATLNVVRVGLIGPDLLVVGFCCLAGRTALHLRRDPGVSSAFLLGLVLALGYYAKAPFFPMAIVFILCACFSFPLSRRTVLLAGLALITFLIVSSPYITFLSLAKGRLTFGDSARLNYGFFINDVQHYQHWQGGPQGLGMPIHPTRKLSDYPEIYEFAAMHMGTYPAWFDPTYWYEGITPHFDWKRQAIVFVLNVALEFHVIFGVGAEIVCVGTILIFLARPRWRRGFWHVWPMWTPGVIALIMFALVHIEQRFLGGWLLLIFAGVICACSLPTDLGTIRVVECIGTAVLITAGASLILQAARETVGAGMSSRSVSIASFLLKNGLCPGDGVAVIGDGSEAYWAHLASLRLVAEIPAGITSRPGHPAMDFWESGPEQQAKALKILKETGAKAVIAGSQLSIEGAVPSIVPAPWEKITGTGAYVYFFPVSEGAARSLF